ncbi:MAG: hypothetical protein ACTSR8_05170 [Promethearchaeota archaeon]
MDKYRNYHLLRLLTKKKLTFNAFLLLVFLALIFILNLVRFSYFFGTDPWLHIIIVKKIAISNTLPMEDYHGTLSLHIFCVVIYYFSGLDFLLIPRYFILYTITLSALILYNIFIRIFKNQNLSILGIFILEISTLGFKYTMGQYWPSALAIIIGLFMFFLFYVRLFEFIKEELPSRKEIFSHIKFFYILIILLFITGALTHILTVVIFLIGFMWIYFIYFLKDIRRGSDFILTIILAAIYLLLTIFGIGEGHYFYLDDIIFPWFIYLISLIIGFFIIIPIALRFKKSLIFTTGRYTATIKGEKSIIYKKIDEKLIILLLGIGSSFIVIFTILNILLFHLNISSLFSGFEIIVFSSLAVWGLILFQKKPRGKPFFIWILFFAGFLGLLALFTIISNSLNSMLARTYIIMSPLIVIGFLAFIYKLIKTNSIKKINIKLFLILFLSFSMTSSLYYEFLIVDEFNIQKRDNSLIKWYSENTDNPNSIYTKFGWQFVFIYNDYPYEDKSSAPNIYDTQNFISFREDLFPPDNHYDDDGNNRLQEIKNETNNDVYILLDDFYIKNDGYETYGHLTEEEKQEYYELTYLNKVASSRSEDGTERALFWVI